MIHHLSRRPSRGTTQDASREALAFYQRRVALFGLVGAGLSSAFVVFGLFQRLTTGVAYERAPGVLFHLAGAATAAAMWLLCRAGGRSLGFVKTVETVGFVGSCLAYEAMAWSIPLIGRPDMLVLFVLSLVVFGRAVYVPSSPRRTLALGLVVGLPLPVGAYLRYHGIEPAQFALLGPALNLRTIEELARGGGIGLGFSFLMAVLLATGASNVIYGLRREAREARRLGQYTLEEKLGEGGMGIVYRARHAMLRRPTAVKLLPRDRAGEASLARFEREVQLTASLTHPNTVTVFDYGRTSDGIFYYAMELLDGASLDSVVSVGGRLLPERVTHVVYHIASALSEAHQVGLIHRDVKPANIILCRQGGTDDVPKVVDFGLVKDLERGTDVSLTQGDVIAGTPLYLSPEAITAPDAMDARSDLYSLGAVGYFALTGTHVFEGRTTVEVCAKHLHDAPERPSRRIGCPLPQDLEAVLLACLAKQPGERPATAAELCRRLESCASFGQWTPEKASAWWREHGAAATARGRETQPTGLTLTRGASVDAG
ncbi:MAG TPA: serine/threonine-protein kinase [Vicinamibacteria bacterium]|nr:serine/threonine-protein kinase [Vicinamibacteria bacterium]